MKDDKGKSLNYFQCMKGVDREGYCLYHFVHANPASTNDDPDDLNIESYSGWIRTIPYHRSRNGFPMSETVITHTPTRISRRYFNTEHKEWNDVSFAMVVAAKDTNAECSGKDKCFLFINRGYYCKRHVLHTEVPEAA